MKFSKLFLLIITVISTVTVFNSCDGNGDDPTIKVTNPKWIVKSGMNCAYGQGYDSIIMKFDTISFIKQAAVVSSNGPYSTSYLNDIEAWNTAIAGIDVEDFARLPYHSTNVLENGCDEWISIQDSDGRIFKISYDPGTVLDSVKVLQQALWDIRAKYDYVD